MRCLYCGKQLALFKRLTRGDFCSSEHQKLFEGHFSDTALARLLKEQPVPEPLGRMFPLPEQAAEESLQNPVSPQEALTSLSQSIENEEEALTASIWKNPEDRPVLRPDFDFEKDDSGEHSGKDDSEKAGSTKPDSEELSGSLSGSGSRPGMGQNAEARTSSLRPESENTADLRPAQVIVAEERNATDSFDSERVHEEAVTHVTVPDPSPLPYATNDEDRLEGMLPYGQEIEPTSFKDTSHEYPSQADRHRVGPVPRSGDIARPTPGLEALALEVSGVREGSRTDRTQPIVSKTLGDVETDTDSPAGDQTAPGKPLEQLLDFTPFETRDCELPPRCACFQAREPDIEAVLPEKQATATDPRMGQGKLPQVVLSVNSFTMSPQNLPAGAPWHLVQPLELAARPAVAGSKVLLDFPAIGHPGRGSAPAPRRPAGPIGSRTDSAILRGADPHPSGSANLRPTSPQPKGAHPAGSTLAETRLEANAANRVESTGKSPDYDPIEARLQSLTQRSVASRRGAKLTAGPKHHPLHDAMLQDAGGDLAAREHAVPDHTSLAREALAENPPPALVTNTLPVTLLGVAAVRLRPSVVFPGALNLETGPKVPEFPALPLRATLYWTEPPATEATGEAKDSAPDRRIKDSAESIQPGGSTPEMIDLESFPGESSSEPLAGGSETATFDAPEAELAPSSSTEEPFSLEQQLHDTSGDDSPILTYPSSRLAHKSGESNKSLLGRWFRSEGHPPEDAGSHRGGDENERADPGKR